jgi:hypothetical protein
MIDFEEFGDSHLIADLKAEIIQLEIMIFQSRNLVIRMETLIEASIERLKQADDAAHGDRVNDDVHHVHE